MACKFICDGCGREASAVHNQIDYFKPGSWFQRSDKDGIQDACSRDCIDKIAAKTGKTSTVIPI